MLDTVIANEDGLKDIRYTVEKLKQYWSNLQYKQLFQGELGDFEGRIYTVILQFFGKESLKEFTDIIQDKYYNNEQMDDQELMQFIMDQAQLLQLNEDPIEI